MSLRHGVRELEPEEIFMELKKLYEGQIERTFKKSCDDSEGAVLRDLIQDLLAQNATLVQVASQLEKEAGHRVAMMESRLRHTAALAAGSDSSAIARCLEAIGMCGDDSLPEREEDASIAVGCNDHCQSSGINTANCVLMQEVVEKDSIIARLESEVTQLSRELSLSESAAAIAKLGSCLADDENTVVSQLEVQLKKSLNENVRKNGVISQLKGELAASERTVTDLKSQIAELEKASREMRDALTCEVAEKHDQLVQMRSEVERLEDAVRNAAMQARFKDDIIREMRQEVRHLRGLVGGV
ncbi:uncharacterized protein LOC124155459 [Ischnura elegans]|uniref:uncharacterized protein LOC124155459 n=1 Tax=Ischnura elegans TaxID=197161 RepID=UPI001ED88B9E|nr:uncharacterized protein LOC124155459 [Ischnura elegans]XP_046385244.1 uncharacterized protein LOC124155459 [Ischnura elegans]XP_046385245.1 uncharacterized protein LOC124155459 [Ischnura elegans]XP_046385246.1 uncharacterized protein LOC124155459 [Ischnura elegans]